jgi:hypothetical protein
MGDNPSLVTLVQNSALGGIAGVDPTGDSQIILLNKKIIKLQSGANR